MSGGVSGKESSGPHELLGEKKQEFPYPDTFLPVTGHADGSVRFWDTTGTAMQQLHRLRTQKLFEKNKVITFS